MEDVANDRFGLILLALYDKQSVCILWENSGIEKALLIGSSHSSPTFSAPALYMKPDLVSTYTLKRG